jgi:Signal peptidase (SPase) II
VLGLIIGGAIGNAIDRLAYGAVADFVLFHITTASLNFRWYVFCRCIVIGVAGLIYEMLLGGEGTRNDAKGPRLTPQIDLAAMYRVPAGDSASRSTCKATQRRASMASARHDAVLRAVVNV